MKNKLIILLLVVLCMILTTGFSSLTSNVAMSDVSAVFRLSDEIRVTEFKPTNTTNSGSSSWSDYNVDNVLTNIILPNQNSTVTYKVKLVNLSNRVVRITNINNLPSNITYELTDYTLGDNICVNNICKLGIEKEFYITFKYKTNGYNSTSNPSGNYVLNAQLELSFNYTVTFNSNGGNPPSFADKLVAYNEEYGQLPTVTKTGNLFLGWFTDAGTQITETTIVTTSNDHELYAHWTPSIYTITFSDSTLNVGGTTIYEKYGVGFFSDSQATQQITSLTPPNPTGYTFNGYYITQNETQVFVVDSSGSIIKSSTFFTSDSIGNTSYTVNSYTCTKGQYLAAGATSCTTCAENGYCPSAGTYNYNASTDQGRTACPGSMTSALGSDEVSDCSITCTSKNYLAAGEGICTPCTEGSYCTGGTYNYNGNTEQGKKACPGNMTSAAQSDEITDCNITCSSTNYLAAGTGTCASCTAGYYCTGGTYNYNENTAQGRTQCVAGSYSTTGQSACTVCGAGKTSVAGTQSSGNCTDCSAITGSTSWETPTWNSSNNTMSNLCTSNGCAGGYRLNSGTCTQCTAGTYALAGSTSCTPCATGTYSSSNGASSCSTCPPSGATGTSGTTNGTGQTSCNANCGKSNVSTWQTPSWNNNSPTNVCTIKTCATYYELSNNNCVKKTKTITINGTPNSKITWSGGSTTLNSSGTKTSVSVPQGKVTFTDGVSGLTEEFTITDSTGAIFLPRVIYWKGTEVYAGGTSGYTAKTAPTGYDCTVKAWTENDNRINFTGSIYESNTRYAYIWGTSSKVSLTGYTKLYINGRTTKPTYSGGSAIAYYRYGITSTKALIGSQPPGVYGAIPESDSTASDASKSISDSGLSSAYVYVSVIAGSTQSSSITARINGIWLGGGLTAASG